MRSLRPRFGDPERFVFFIWPKWVSTLQELGVWGRILDRVLAAEHPQVEAQCQEALRELSLLEYREIVRAITETATGRCGSAHGGSGGRRAGAPRSCRGAAGGKHPYSVTYPQG
ncbi:MAG: hypothetical protein HY689_14710 [Chloroflexi bacterium]|nr:hypothetical protein [Chloroflexota bacterium]